MREQSLYRKMIKARALAGENPITSEELAAEKVANDLELKLKRKKHRSILQQIGYGALVPYTNDSQIPKNKMDIKNLIKIEKEKIITLQVIPDSSVRNYKTEDIAKLIVRIFRLPKDRFKRNGIKVTYKEQEKVCFEIRMMKGEIIFLFHLPVSLQTIFTKKIQSVWEKCTIQQVTDNFNYIEDKTVIQELSYRKHDLYSLSVDSKNTDPLGSIFEGSRLLDTDDTASVYAMFEPIHQYSVQTELQEVWRKLRDGEAPKRWSFTFHDMIVLAGAGLSGLFRELTEIISGFISSEEANKENKYTKKYVANPEASKMAINNLSDATKKKSGKDILRVGYFVAASSDNEDKARIITKTICNGINDLAGDNDLIPRELKKKKKTSVIAAMNNRTVPKINIRSNLMSVGECGRLMQLPGDELLTKFKDITSIKTKESDIDKVLRKSGIKLGHVTFRGEKIPVYLPCMNYNELCLPTVIIGGMGVGKSTEIANRAIQYNLQGFGCIIVDPAKGEIGDLIERVLPPENIIRINLARTPISLEWCEVYRLKKYRNLLANAIVAFFDDQTDNAGARTKRYLKSMVYGMQTGKLQEVVDILENEKYREKVIKSMPEGMHKMTLQEFHGHSAARQLEIKMPIYNRLDIILGDEFLTECMQSENQLNIVDFMESNKCIILDVPKKELGKDGVDLICNLISSKIDMAMTSRDENKAAPFFILFDELHQMQRSTEIWKNAAVESRKWRVGYNFIFHSFEQLDKKLISIIQDSGPNYSLYKSSQKTFKILEKEIAPFTIEDGIKLERHYAIQILNADNRVIDPFICKMNDPS